MTAYAISGTHESTTSLILAEEPFLLRLAQRYAGRHADAEDLVQETMARAWVARGRFAPGTCVRAWLAVILRRLYLTGAMKDKRRSTRTNTDADEPIDRITVIKSYFGDASVPEYASVLQHVDERMTNAIGQLPDHYRIPILLFALEGLTYAEIGERLRIPVGTVMSRVHRARIRLQATLAMPAARATG
jgi:RNA polymerase sigma-70 factor, ECF subfamily